MGKRGQLSPMGGAVVTHGGVSPGPGAAVTANGVLGAGAVSLGCVCPPAPPPPWDGRDGGGGGGGVTCANLGDVPDPVPADATVTSPGCPWEGRW